MGRYNKSFPRLVKIDLPRSFYVDQVLRRAYRLKHYFISKLFLRPSLSEEERKRARTERVARRNTRLIAMSEPSADVVASQPQSSSVSIVGDSNKTSASEPTNV